MNNIKPYRTNVGKKPFKLLSCVAFASMLSIGINAVNAEENSTPIV